MLPTHFAFSLSEDAAVGDLLQQSGPHALDNLR